MPFLRIDSLSFGSPWFLSKSQNILIFFFLNPLLKNCWFQAPNQLAKGVPHKASKYWLVKGYWIKFWDWSGWWKKEMNWNQFDSIHIMKRFHSFWSLLSWCCWPWLALITSPANWVFIDSSNQWSKLYLLTPWQRVVNKVFNVLLIL